MTEGATAAVLLGVAGMGSRLHGNDGGGYGGGADYGGVAGMGSRLHGNDGGGRE